MSNKNTINYRRVGDYNLPNPTFLLKEINIILYKWGVLQKKLYSKSQKSF